MLRRILSLFIVPALLSVAVLAASEREDVLAHAISGAIFTTVADGSEVNQNIFPSREAVYLDGGPGPGAPQDAAGLDDGRYVFQVTNPNGATLLSTDAAKCRRFDVSGGVITNVVATGGCEHVTGNDVDHPPAKTVQLFPFNLTPNPGGVYKAWVTREVDFLLGCQQLGFAGATGLDAVNCGNAPGNRHGFIPSHSKTDNFKVKKARDGVEIDVRFFDDSAQDGHYNYDEALIAHMQIVWTDTNGVKNNKFSDPNYQFGTFAHVEAAEPGVHLIEIIGGPGCNVGLVHVDNVDQAVGPQTVQVTVLPKEGPDDTHFIDVACVP